jgi:membrane protease YdiL (CAAX protease family)
LDFFEPIPRIEERENAPTALPTPPERISGENPAWNLLDVLLVVVFTPVAIAISSLALIVATLISQHSLSSSPADLAKNTPLLVGFQTLLSLIVMGFMWITVRVKCDGPVLKAISWNMPGLSRAALFLLAGVLLAAFSQAASALLSRWTPSSLPMDDLFRTRASAFSMMIFGILVAPPTEELFFRGFLYPALARRLGVTVSVVITTAGFAMLHADQLGLAWAPLLIIFMVGAVLTGVRAYTKSVATTVIIHMGYNLTLFTLMFIGTQGFRHMDRL